MPNHLHPLLPPGWEKSPPHVGDRSVRLTVADSHFDTRRLETLFGQWVDPQQQRPDRVVIARARQHLAGHLCLRRS
jgi:hypothetical protein